MPGDRKINYRFICESVDVEHIFEWLDIEMSENEEGTQYRGRCPLCNCRDDRTLIYTKEELSWCCVGRCKPRPNKKKLGGDIIDLVARIKEISNPEAALLIEEEFLGNSKSSTAMPRRERHNVPASRRATVPAKRAQEIHQERQIDSPAGMDPLDYLDPAHEDVEALGMSAEDAEMIGAGYANKGVLRGLVAVPIRDDQGVLCGYVGVSEGRVGKLHIPKKNVVPFNKRRA
ncbi:MAG TPA: hypothetical protein VHY35_06230 [Stellaceae bacterium]|nr:hypothetical protein [Stellaceae bacterium]